jgi:hypothetical protein
MFSNPSTVYLSPQITRKQNSEQPIQILIIPIRNFSGRKKDIDSTTADSNRTGRKNIQKIVERIANQNL